MEIQTQSNPSSPPRLAVNLLFMFLMIGIAPGGAEASLFKQRGFSKRSRGVAAKQPSSKASGGKALTVRTTAYTHSESDHRKYGCKNAIGTNLKYGETRSAAADWSIFPVGTTFRISGDPNLYVIDDYGSALVGKRTIDLYKPSRGSMNAWGVRNVQIRVVEWGSIERSLEVLRERTRFRHVREMVRGLEEKI